MLGMIVVLLSTKPVVDIFRVVAGKGILYSAVATGVLGFVTAIVFLFCTPDLDVLFSLNAPQPFVLLYSLAIGKKGSVFMTILAVLGLLVVRFLFNLNLREP